jgi:hypothetical protein
MAHTEAYGLEFDTDSDSDAVLSTGWPSLVLGTIRHRSTQRTDLQVPQNASPLLELPVELRLGIYAQLYDFYQVGFDISFEVKTTKDGSNYLKPIWRCRTFDGPLLHVNQQLQDEVMDFLFRKIAFVFCSHRTNGYLEDPVAWLDPYQVQIPNPVFLEFKPATIILKNTQTLKILIGYAVHWCTQDHRLCCTEKNKHKGSYHMSTFFPGRDLDLLVYLVGKLSENGEDST